MIATMKLDYSIYKGLHLLASLTTEIEITEEQKQIIIFHRIAMELALPAISSSIT